MSFVNRQKLKDPRGWKRGKDGGDGGEGVGKKYEYALDGTNMDKINIDVDLSFPKCDNWPWGKIGKHARQHADDTHG